MAANRNSGGFEEQGDYQRELIGKANQSPFLTTKTFRKIFADFGLVVHCFTVQRHLHKYDLHGRLIRGKPLLSPHHKI